jgi:hypothetical protein
MFPGSRRAEHLNLRSQQRIVDTVEDSVLRTEMTDLESQEEDVPKRILFFKSMRRPNPSDSGEAVSDLWLQEISIMTPR